MSELGTVQDVDEAMKRLPVEVIDARNQRLKRAHDVSLKKHYLPKALQDKQTPYLTYIQVCDAQAPVVMPFTGHYGPQ